MNIYYTHDNGSRPFKVVINKKDISIYREYEIDYEKDEYGYEDKAILKFSNVEKIFIGKNPGYYPPYKMPSLEYIKEDDGNSILLQIKNNKYVFIGGNIFSFHSYEKITKFISPIGNNDVPYPFAIDKDKNYYLMIEDVIFNPKVKIDDPYDYYYQLLQNKKTFKKYNIRSFKSLKILQERLIN